MKTKKARLSFDSFAAKANVIKKSNSKITAGILHLYGGDGDNGGGGVSDPKMPKNP